MPFGMWLVPLGALKGRGLSLTALSTGTLGTVKKAAAEELP